MIFYYFSQSPKVTRHAVGKTTAFGILQEENEKEYSYECVWSERKECIKITRTYAFATDWRLSSFSFNAVRMLVCLGAVVSAGLASAKRAAGKKNIHRHRRTVLEGGEAYIEFCCEGAWYNKP